MRKLKLVVVILTMLIISSSSAITAIAGTSTSELIKGEGVASAVVMQDTLYAVSSGKIISFSSPQSQANILLNLADTPQIHEGDREWLLLATDGHTLYVISPFDGLVYALESGKLREVVKLDISLMGVDRGKGRRYVIFDYPVVIEDDLYLLFLDPNHYQSKELYSFSLKNGAAKKIELDGLELLEMSVYQEKQLLVVDRNTEKIMVLNPSDGKIVSELGTLSSSEDGAIIYSSSDRQLYCLSSTKLLRLRGNANETIGYVPFNGRIDAKYAGMWQGHYAVLASTGLYAFDTHAASASVQKKTVTIWFEPGTFPDTELLTRFMLEHPDIAIVSTGSRDENPLERLTTVNLSRDASIDIFMLPSYLIESQRVFDKGYALPIESDILQKDVQVMYKQVQGFLTHDGQLYSYPADLFPSYWSVRPELLKQAGFSEIPTTYDAYFDMMYQWYEQNFGKHLNYSFDGNKTIRDQQRSAVGLLIMQHIQTFESIDQAISFNTPAFRSALEKLHTFGQYKVKEATGANRNPSVYEPRIFDTKAISPFTRILNPEHEGEQCILPPTFAPGEAPKLNASMLYFIVNPNSKNTESAIKFLEFYSEHMAPVSKYMLYPGMNDLIESSAYQASVQESAENIAIYQRGIEQTKETIEKMNGSETVAEYQATLEHLQEALLKEEAALASLEKQRYVYSKEVIDEYRQLAPFISFQHGSLVWAIFEEIGAEAILAKYFEGMATLDQVLSELDRRVAIMYYEGQ